MGLFGNRRLFKLPSTSKDVTKEEPGGAEAEQIRKETPIEEHQTPPEKGTEKRNNKRRGRKSPSQPGKKQPGTDRTNGRKNDTGYRPQCTMSAQRFLNFAVGSVQTASNAFYRKRSSDPTMEQTSGKAEADEESKQQPTRESDSSPVVPNKGRKTKMNYRNIREAYNNTNKKELVQQKGKDMAQYGKRGINYTVEALKKQRDIFLEQQKGSTLKELKNAKGETVGYVSNKREVHQESEPVENHDSIEKSETRPKNIVKQSLDKNHRIIEVEL